MPRKFSLPVVLFVLLLFVPTAYALPLLSIESESGTYGKIPGNATNDVLDDVYGSGTTIRWGYYGSTISLTSDALVTFTFLGYEAGWSNDFNLSGTELFNNKTSAWNSSAGPFMLTSGIIPFQFDIDSNRLFLSNAGNPDDASGYSGPNFFTSFDQDPAALLGDSLVIFLDDGGAGPDDNHDDMAIRIQASAPAPVPEPGTMLLLGTGLIGLAGVRRKMKR